MCSFLPKERPLALRSTATQLISFSPVLHITKKISESPLMKAFEPFMMKSSPSSFNVLVIAAGNYVITTKIKILNILMFDKL